MHATPLPAADERRLLHAETLAPMLPQLPQERKLRPRDLPPLLRRSFPNWFQSHYQHLYVAFRGVRKESDEA